MSSVVSVSLLFYLYVLVEIDGTTFPLTGHILNK